MVSSFTVDGTSSGIMIDEETGTQWDVSTGLAVYGPLIGSRLSPIFATSAFDFGWSAYFPEGSIYSSR